jgi:hypothetical protein
VGEMTAAVVLRRGLQVLKDASGFARLTRGCGGEPIRAERASDSLKPSGAHLATKARYAPIGVRAGIGQGKQGIENSEQRVVGRRAYNRAAAALHLGREAPPCILSRGRKGASRVPAGESKWAGR